MEYKLIDPSSYNFLLWFIYTFTFIVIISYFVTLFVNYLLNRDVHRINQIYIRLKRNFHFLRSIFISLLILISIIFIFLLATEVFNNGRKGFGNLSLIPKDIGTWADFATCMTLPIALISFFYVYRTFQSQALATKRSSFDVTFTQMFAQHNILREKVVRHLLFAPFPERDIKVDFFSFFRIKAFSLINERFNITDFYNSTIRVYDLRGAIDFKNYCKFVYHEVQMVAINEYLNENVKRRYIRLIQGQMNNDELFCYLINQIEYISHKRQNWIETNMNENLRLWEEQRVSYIDSIEYARQLRYYDFFRDLCEDDHYRNNIGILYNTYIDELNYLINPDWMLN